jgi:hypothetical protein
VASFRVAFFLGVAILGAASLSQIGGGSATGVSVLQGRTEDLSRAQLELGRAIVAVREAEAAGADQGRVKNLVDQLNLALSMIDTGQQLLSAGDIAGAALQAQRSIELTTKLGSDAGRLRDESAQKTYYGRIFTFAMVPVASLLLTVVAHYGWIWWGRREVERLMRMEIKSHMAPDEEKQ